MNKLKSPSDKSYSVLRDLFFIVLLVLISLFLVSFYFGATYLSTGYADWLVHAFRVRSLGAFGFSSWSHMWANGISLWKSYQFIPHFITLAVSKFFGVEVTRAMVLLTITLFVLLRLFIYSVLRLLKFSSLTAFFCSLLSFDIAQYWGGVSDYSLLFGFTLFPIVLYIWTHFIDGKLQYLFPYIIGILFYVHPLLGFVSCGLWALAVITGEAKTILRMRILQIAIILASSSLFWFPILFKTSYSYTSTVLADREYLNLVLAPYSYYGLSIFLIGSFAVSLGSFISIPGTIAKWIKVLTFFTSLYVGLVLLGTHVALPRSIDQFQFTRGVTFIGISMVFIFAPVIENIFRRNSTIFKAAIYLMVLLAVIEGIWFTSIYAPAPTTHFEEPITSVIRADAGVNFVDGRVWTPVIDESSYFAPLNSQFPHSYMGHLEPNQVSHRMLQLISYQPYIGVLPESSVARVVDYLKITGTKYVIFEESSPFTKSFQISPHLEYKNLGGLNLSHSSYHLYQALSPQLDALLIDPRYKQHMEHFPFGLDFGKIDDQIVLDSYVNQFVGILSKPENQQLKATYPSQESIDIHLEEGRTSHLVYVNESYDASWAAYFNDRKQQIQSVGPNFMLVTLDSPSEGGLLTLRHSWPMSFYISLFIIAAIPVELALYTLLRRITRVRVSRERKLVYATY